MRDTEWNTHREGTFEGAAGLRLYFQSWQPCAEPRAILVLLHGLGGHSGTFQNVAEYLLPTCVATYAFDLRGHGRSPGQRGHINAWSEFREDLSAFLRFIDDREQGCPRFLIGHSLGAVIILDYILRSQANVSGIIALAPALGKVGVPLVKLALGRVLSTVWPRFSLDTGIELTAGSRDRPVLESYLSDPLRHTKGTARLATEFFDTVVWIQVHAAELRTPLLILHGGADRIALPEGSQTFVEKVVFSDKERREYPGVYHDMCSDLDCLLILADIRDWLDRHLASSACAILPDRSEQLSLPEQIEFHRAKTDRRIFRRWGYPNAHNRRLRDVKRKLI
jgi:alpha-beta hydrolase superfamily lysophospholipase